MTKLRLTPERILMTPHLLRMWSTFTGLCLLVAIGSLLLAPLTTAWTIGTCVAGLIAASFVGYGLLKVLWDKAA